MKHIAILLAALMLSVTAAAAGPNSGRITVTGQGRAAAVPDMATITLGVSQSAKQAPVAMGLVSDKVARILTRLEQRGIAPRDIQTRQLSLTPRRSNAASGGAQVVGFKASVTMMVRLRDLDRLGAILAVVLADGSNTFDGLQLSIQDPAPLVKRARHDAVSDAMARAGLYAKAAGVRLGPILSIVEQGGNPGPVTMAMASTRDAGVPVAPGEVSVSASVTMVFAIAN